MNPFFIFLDIDGTLWDNSQTDHNLVTNDQLNLDSINALNNLIDNLTKLNYDPCIVVISKRRVFWQSCKYFLYYHGVNEDVPMLKLPIGKFTRGERISIFLHDYACGRDICSGSRKYSFFDKLFFNYSKHAENYVVIDDNYKALENIPAEHYIKTNIKNGALNQKMVDNYLEQLSNNPAEIEK